ncbi:hypothetical protein HY469_02210 [Candidatus Roizmanbacteria bacterium]|nr:hypothetical protein [Candidatus Roizmanbacteria bacterium]
MNIKLSDLPVEQLKALAYDQIQQFGLLKQAIDQIDLEIRRRADKMPEKVAEAIAKEQEKPVKK